MNTNSNSNSQIMESILAFLGKTEAQLFDFLNETGATWADVLSHLSDFIG